MKTNKIWWSLLVALMLPLSFALTACSDDDDDDKDGGSSKLDDTSWFGSDSEGNNWGFAFYDGEFEAYSNGDYYDGRYSISGSKIRFKGVRGDDDAFEDGSYDYKISGRRGDRTLRIYDILVDGGDMYLEELDYEGSGSDDDWDEDW